MPETAITNRDRPPMLPSAGPECKGSPSTISPTADAGKSYAGYGHGNGRHRLLYGDGGGDGMIVTYLLNDLFHTKHECGQRQQGTGDGKPNGGTGTDVGIAGLHLIGLHIEHVVLLHVVVGRGDQVGVVQVENMNFLVPGSVFTDQLHMVANTVDGQVAGLGKGLKNGDFLIANGEHARMLHLTEHGNLIVGHAHRHNRTLILVKERPDVVENQFLAGGLRQPTHGNIADNGKVDAAVIVHQITLEH